MKYLFISIALFLSLSTFAQTLLEQKQEADKEWTKAENMVNAAESQEETIRRSIETQNKVINKTLQEIREQERYLKKNEKAYSKKRGGFFGFYEDNTQDDFTQEYDRRKSELSGLEARRKMEEEKLENMQSQLGKAIDNFDDKLDKRAAAGNKVDETDFKLLVAKGKLEKELMDSTALMMEHEIVGQKLENVGLQLDRIKDKYDNMLLGSYMRDRMLKLMNSDAFCNQAQACAQGKKPVLSDDAMNSIFKGYIPAAPRTTNSSNNGSGTR